MDDKKFDVSNEDCIRTFMLVSLCCIIVYLIWNLFIGYKTKIAQVFLFCLSTVSSALGLGIGLIVKTSRNMILFFLLDVILSIFLFCAGVA